MARDLKSLWLFSAHRESKTENVPLQEMHYKYCWTKPHYQEKTLESAWSPQAARKEIWSFPNTKPCSQKPDTQVLPYLLMSKFIQYCAQLLCVAVKFMSCNGWVGIPPVNGEAMVPEVPALLDVCWLDAGVKAMYLTSTVGHAKLKLVVIIA